MNSPTNGAGKPLLLPFEPGDLANRLSRPETATPSPKDRRDITFSYKLREKRINRGLAPSKAKQLRQSILCCTYWKLEADHLAACFEAQISTWTLSGEPKLQKRAAQLLKRLVKNYEQLFRAMGYSPEAVNNIRCEIESEEYWHTEGDILDSFIETEAKRQHHLSDRISPAIKTYNDRVSNRTRSKTKALARSAGVSESSRSSARNGA